MKIIDGTKLIESCIRLATERPDVDIEDCRYFGLENANYVPSCIVGHALAEQGVTVEDLQRVVNPTSLSEHTDYNSELVRDVLTSSMFKFDGTSEQLDWIETIQSHQDDDGITWGQALARTQSEFP